MNFLVATVSSLLLGLAVALFTSVPTWLLWNWLVPRIFGLPPISWLEALGLLLLLSCLTGRHAHLKFEE